MKKTIFALLFLFIITNVYSYVKIWEVRDQQKMSRLVKIDNQKYFNYHLVVSNPNTNDNYVVSAKIIVYRVSAIMAEKTISAGRKVRNSYFTDYLVDPTYEISQYYFELDAPLIGDWAAIRIWW